MVFIFLISRSNASWEPPDAADVVLGKSFGGSESRALPLAFVDAVGSGEVIGWLALVDERKRRNGTKYLFDSWF